MSVRYTWWYVSVSSPCQWCCCHTHAIESKRGLLRLLEWLREGEEIIPAWPGILHIYPCCRITQPTGCYHTHTCLAVFYSHLLILVGWLCSVIRTDALWWPRIFPLPPRRGEPPPLLCGFTGPRTKEPAQRNPRYACSGHISMLIAGHHPWMPALYILYRTPNTCLHDIAELLVVLRFLDTLKDPYQPKQHSICTQLQTWNDTMEAKSSLYM